MSQFLLESGVPTIHTLNTTVPLPDGVSVRVQPTTGTRSFGDDHQLAAAVITFGANVSASLVASWLFQHFKQRKTRRIRINRKEITIDSDNAVKVIEESIQIDE